MKTKMLIIPFMAMLLSFAVSGCYVHRPYDPYYNSREYRYKHRHHRDRDHDRDRDRHDYEYHRY